MKWNSQLKEMTDFRTSDADWVSSQRLLQLNIELFPIFNQVNWIFRMRFTPGSHCSSLYVTANSQYIGEDWFDFDLTRLTRASIIMRWALLSWSFTLLSIIVIVILPAGFKLNWMECPLSSRLLELEANSSDIAESKYYETGRIRRRCERDSARLNHLIESKDFFLFYLFIYLLIYLFFFFWQKWSLCFWDQVA